MSEVREKGMAMATDSSAPYPYDKPLLARLEPTIGEYGDVTWQTYGRHGSLPPITEPTMAFGEKSIDELLGNFNERIANKPPLDPEASAELHAKTERAAAEIALQQEEQVARDRGEVVARDIENAERNRKREEEAASQQDYNDYTEPQEY